MQQALLKKKRKKLFDSLSTTVVSDDQTFWTIIKPFFINKGSFGRNIKLAEKEEILKDYTKIAEELNLFFSNAVRDRQVFLITLISQAESLII